MTYKIDAEKVRELATGKKNDVDLSGINFGMLEMLEIWAEREWIKKESGLPSEWDQGLWLSVRGEAVTGTACGTAACLAGKAISITPGVSWYKGGAVINEFSSLPVGSTFNDALLPAAIVPSDIQQDYRWNKVEQDGKEYFSLDASIAGAIVLGLNPREANALFAGENTINDVKRIIIRIKNGDFRVDEYDDEIELPIVELGQDDLCGMNAQTYVESLVPHAEDVFEYAYGDCVLLKHGDDVEHIFGE